jgi:tetratricopeptide (TPR) repeat protein
MLSCGETPGGDGASRTRRERAGRADYAKARILIMGGRRKEALRELRRVLRRNPRDVDALFQLARVRVEMGNAARARKLLGKCARLDKRGKWTREIVAQLRRLD